MIGFQHISCVSCSDKGLVRSNNEDAFLCLEDAGCYVVSDGMGGAEAGEIASQIVVDAIRNALSGMAEDSPGMRKYEVQQAVHLANRKVQEYADAHKFHQMGATMVLFLADSWEPDVAWLCHVGDSRIYRFRNGKLVLLTRDHTVGQELKGMSERMSHVLTRAVGIAPNVFPEWTNTDLHEGDVFLLCSDGVYTMLTEEQLEAIFQQENEPDALLARLEEAVRLGGAKDNYTAVICTIGALPTEGKEEHSQEEIDESNYLVKISEERLDYA